MRPKFLNIKKPLKVLTVDRLDFNKYKLYQLLKYTKPNTTANKSLSTRKSLYYRATNHSDFRKLWWRNKRFSPAFGSKRLQLFQVVRK